MTNTLFPEPPKSVEINQVKASDMDEMIPGGIGMLPLLIGGMIPSEDTAEPPPDSFVSMFQTALNDKKPIQLSIRIGDKGWVLEIAP